ncbi:MAG: PAS domain-containing protein [Methylobacterium mesophilicum]|nr:PAS domain-containing protein [Methylobacterium mesophilicum]
MDLDYSPLLGADGEPFGVLVIVAETTAQVITRRALARSQEQLSFAFDASGIVGSWDWSVAEDRVKADARFAELYGVDREAAREGVPIDTFMEGIHADDRAMVAEAIRRAVAGGDELRVEYRISSPGGGARWVLALGRVARDETGAPRRLPGIVLDISDRRTQEALLAASEAKFRAIADSMPQMVWSTQADGFHDYYNARWYEFTGMPEGSTDGEEWNGMFHPDDQARAWEVWRHSLETGEPYEIEYRLRHHSGEYRWTLGRALPIRDDRGRIVRWMGTCTDIHETKIAAEEREVVAQELSHRIKNIFSVLTGIVSLSARAYPEAKQFASELRQRIFAMGRAHDFVRPHSRASIPRAEQHSLKALVEQLVVPFESEEHSMRLSFTGDDAVIDEAAATPLALLFHELATNSAKYGAFSARDGHVAITGKREGDRYGLVWKEQGGPVVEAAPREGFGTRLIALSVEGQLGGKLLRFWEPDGLRIAIDVPIAALSRSGRLQKRL